MRWLSVCVLSVVWVTVAPVELRCVTDCLDGAAHDYPQLGFSRTFMVQDYRIQIYYKAYNDVFELHLNCYGKQALDYPYLPSFSSIFQVHTVVLESCPPPYGERSFKNVLDAMNVTLEKILPNDEITLKLVKLPSYPKLKESHFAGLEYLTTLKIDNTIKLDHPKPETTFLWPLLRLHHLELLRIKIPFNETTSKNVTSLTITETGLVRKLYSKYALSSRRRRAARSIAARESTETDQRHRYNSRPTRRQHSQPSHLDNKVYNTITRF